MPDILKTYEFETYKDAFAFAKDIGGNNAAIQTLTRKGLFGQTEKAYKIAINVKPHFFLTCERMRNLLLESLTYENYSPTTTDK